MFSVQSLLPREGTIGVNGSYGFRNLAGSVVHLLGLVGDAITSAEANIFPELSFTVDVSGLDKTSIIKHLRERTSAPIKEVKSALVNCNWDIGCTERPEEERCGVSLKKSSRTAAEGLRALVKNDKEKSSKSDRAEAMFADLGHFFVRSIQVGITPDVQCTTDMLTSTRGLSSKDNKGTFSSLEADSCIMAKHQKRRQELTQTTPDQPLYDEAVYYKVAGDCPKGCVYSPRSLRRKKRRYVDPDASTSQDRLQMRRQELTQATPDQPVDDEAVYLNVVGECPKGHVYGLGSVGRKKRRYANPGASTSQMPETVPRAEFDIVADQLRKVMAFMHQQFGMTMDGAGLSQPQPPLPPPPPPPDKQQLPQIDPADPPQQGDNVEREAQECYIRLSEYEGVCPFYRGDVCEGVAESLVFSSLALDCLQHIIEGWLVLSGIKLYSTMSRLQELAFSLAHKCLSFAFEGTSLDESSEEFGTVCLEANSGGSFKPANLFLLLCDCIFTYLKGAAEWRSLFTNDVQRSKFIAKFKCSEGAVGVNGSHGFRNLVGSVVHLLGLVGDAITSAEANIFPELGCTERPEEKRCGVSLKKSSRTAAEGLRALVKNDKEKRLFLVETRNAVELFDTTDLERAHVTELQDGSALFITVVKYLSPSRHDIDQVGITPDVQCTTYMLTSTRGLSSKDNKRTSSSLEVDSYIMVAELLLEMQESKGSAS
ncbi:hypothetical protein Syun_018710 [Stephania yunnanensis]|uniref:Uncharacterized protein n=1 Tax=Stephania yunnanensis TaxID=152371 RepID=A0AAP0ISR2_9MAGN